MQMLAMSPLTSALPTWTRATVAPPSGPVDRFVPSDRDEFSAMKQLREQAVRYRVGNADDKPNVGAALGQGVLQGEMTAAGMKPSSPPTEAELATYYKKHAPHHDLIAKGKFGQAAAAYRKDLAALKEDDPQRELLEKRAEQLDYTASIKAKNFPPQFAEVKRHFSGLQKAPGKTVNEEFSRYARTFYEHVQKTDRKADIVYDHEGGQTIRGEKGTWGTDTPEDFKDIADQRGVSGTGRRLVDCEGYAWMGEQLFTAAGYRQAKQPDGGYLVMRGKGDEAHVIVAMERGKDSAVVSNSTVEPNVSEGLESASKALDLPTRKGAEVYFGRSEREALVHMDQRNRAYKLEVR